MAAGLTDGARCDPFDLYPMQDRRELEKLAIFGICVAGKSARIAWPKVLAMLDPAVWWAGMKGEPPPHGPFELMAFFSPTIAEDLLKREKVKMGQYSRIGRALEDVARLPPYWTWRDLLNVHGVHLKTAKMVQLYDAGNPAPCACLDVHVLRAMKTWPRVNKLKLRVPDQAPADHDLYAVLEALFAREAEELGLACWELDKKLWLAGSSPAAGKGVA